MLIPRHLESRLRESARHFPIVTLTGPRQSGKTTLCKATFPRHAYVSLEAPDERAFALEDPRGFLSRFGGPVILDEIQRAPDLFSYIQVEADARDTPGRFILTGSQNFLLLERISQSLAGRTAVLHLLPLTLSEIAKRPAFPLARLAETGVTRRPGTLQGMAETLFRGFFPRVLGRGIPAREWLGSYVQTYLERDVRSVVNVGDLETFGRFLRICAGRSGQLLNLSGLASDVGVTHTTARRWISVLEASFLVTLLRPHHRNFGKRLIRSPKLYLLDTGLLCFLLEIRSPEQLETHSARGPIFESFVVAEVLKNFLNRGEIPDLHFWRDAAGHEVDLIVGTESGEIPIEVKSGQTVPNDALKGLQDYRALTGEPSGPAVLIHGGTLDASRNGVNILPWNAL